MSASTYTNGTVSLAELKNRLSSYVLVNGFSLASGGTGDKLHGATDRRIWVLPAMSSVH